jgi:hypothetical protein
MTILAIDPRLLAAFRVGTAGHDFILKPRRACYRR